MIIIMMIVIIITITIMKIIAACPLCSGGIPCSAKVHRDKAARKKKSILAQGPC